MGVAIGMRWYHRKENLLAALGFTIIIFEVVSAEVLGRPFHIEFLILGAALCGVSITQWGDKR